ncbi:MAG: bifunctional diaminohydroxyphosphoribosylaminopyrimidine deaminase/5-amino-6-(5-phosphoribosylamino)uracil reductase RibD, partial [Gemmatimonadota bacterium]|nr:bifunctional diaminohydroxyphosphoribosylaminopyrimidine deaminase/5-amino-6-(5-phosphoribosylamino)uracil reductase RibD [Gemmatimonadota bacterium]
MREALSLAVLGWGQTSPNPLVGAVVIADGVKIGEGYHATFGGPHAEVVALDSSGARATGSTLYVTLEPCNHQGRTPPCVDTIIAAGVSRVVIATQDPNPVAAGGASRLRSAGIQVDVGILEDEARELNAAFLHSFTSERPWVTLKLAMSLDGAIAGPRRRRERLTNELSNAVVQRLRAGSDGIAVGVETAIADDPALTARSDPPPRIFPVRIVFDRSARLPTDSRLAATAREFGTVIVSSSTTPFPMRLAELGVDVLTARDLADALRKLRQRG